ncbi:PP2C family protein-serine/threonine phosphatase [Tengunoibacter tsumagoiensis]|uniref:PPM-type phosphatase domain-containing protein n=1 Tax=Tengunoibacter tsumagoiensis TaxID=2014871 RepID=A0A402A5Z9_9CHLR|nr:protein phosphatase 2C domain-containing protein [Tengunoibacter tsumagoiensis]GCE14574.1 hypothetical protein KTT_44330 [Tengunoibacter tsumagoiensis]
MLAEFKNLYAIHHWLRYVTWAGFFGVALCMLFFGGAPLPSAWWSLATVISQAQHQWSLSGATSLMALVEPLFWSLFWLLLWLLWLLGVLKLISYQRVISTNLTGQKRAHWVSSQRLSLATAGSSFTIDEKISAAPRLHLPHRSTDVVPDQRSEPYMTLLRRAEKIQEIPTRPIPLLPRPDEQYRTALVQPLQIGVGWDTGLARRSDPNEDNLCVFQATCTYRGMLVPFGLFVVADGMGGHDHGQEASRIAVQHMMHTVLQNVMMGSDLSDEFLLDMLIGGVEWGNLAIYGLGQAHGSEMGTTLTAAFVVGRKAYIANVGDSRTYLFREGEGLRPITHDHSLVASLVKLGQITPEQVYTHPERNKVYRSLGNSDTLKVDTFVVPLLAHDRLILCSDGLWEMVRDPLLERIVRSSNDVMFVSASLVQAALSGGGADNISVIVVQVP